MDCIAAYRKSIALQPSFGEPIGASRISSFSALHVAGNGKMRVQLQYGKLADDDRYHLQFALGKALEVEGLSANPSLNMQKEMLCVVRR